MGRRNFLSRAKEPFGDSPPLRGAWKDCWLDSGSVESFGFLMMYLHLVILLLVILLKISAASLCPVDSPPTQEPSI